MSTARTFENCWRFSYLSDNWGVFFEHRRNGEKWISEKRDRYGNTLGRSVRTDSEMRHIFNHMQCVAECDFYRLSTAADFSPYSS